MKIATASYPPDFLADFDAYADKITRWVAEAAGQGAELLVFPEYGAMELATIEGRATALDLEASIHAVSDRIPQADALHSDLASRFRVHILAASAPVLDPAIALRPVNRARLFTPTGAMGVQDKQIMTRFERETWDIVPGGPLRLFDTSLGRIGVLICYDSEFPLLGRALKEADLILVPSVTEALAGHSRVRIGAQARALENQCVTVMASVVGQADWSEAIDVSTGRGAVFGPPDTGFPPTGVLAEGALNDPGWVYAEVDLEAIAHVRRDGVVLNRTHWDDQSGRDVAPPLVPLR
ncbi:carbon-nitrogen hydrolase family protein [Thetidibacter halocola]|uniref:Carbon-nitrogen hydrolase family protein n=1 Tax=Thetidibacter halocola TaxID=2827239 RepID=A0A8J8B711_9RHOB|nr:carbon-nitrogen hydrolase family protein [Thetidibacter halocola]MBS0123090.1 carbon-nitrogen hydrolase family protein [Thetidibacter halocola]